MSNQLTNTKLVWPEEFPGGDRINEQLHYVPKDYKYDKAPIKQILMANGIGWFWEEVRLGQEEFIGCPVSQCWLTIDMSLGAEVDAVFYRHFYFRPEFERPPNQVIILVGNNKLLLNICWVVITIQSYKLYIKRCRICILYQHKDWLSGLF